MRPWPGCKSSPWSWAIAILAIMHTRKMQADDLMDMVSGSYGTTGAADTIIVLGRRPAGRVMDVRGREVEPNEFAVVFDEPTCRWSIRGDAAEIHMGDQRAEILGVLVADGQPMKAAEIAAEAGIKRASVDTVLMRMATDGQIQRVKRGVYAHKGWVPPSDGAKMTLLTLLTPQAQTTPLTRTTSGQAAGPSVTWLTEVSRSVTSVTSENLCRKQEPALALVGGAARSRHPDRGFVGRRRVQPRGRRASGLGVALAEMHR